MGLTFPIALVLLSALAPAWWLARRAAGRTLDHPLWFLIDAGPGVRARRGAVARSRLLLVAAVGLIAIAAAGPVRVERGGARVLVVDLSATRTLDVDAIRTQLAGYDEVVLAAPGVAPRRLPARAAAGLVRPTRGTIDAAGLAAAVELALPGARAVEVAAAPPPGDDAAIAAARFHRDPLAPRRGRLVIELTLAGAAATPTAVVARAGGVERARAVPHRSGAIAVAVLPYQGDGDEVLTVALEPAGADRLPVDDVATVAVPRLAPASVWIDPALAGGPAARALAVIPTVAPAPAPGPDVLAVVASTGWRGPARARIVVAAPPPGAAIEPLLAVTGAPLPGATPTLLAAAAPVAVDPTAGGRADPTRVWLRAGPHAAVWLDDVDGTPVLRIAAALDGPVLPIVLADALAAPPLAATAAPAEVADVRPPPTAPPVPAGRDGDRRGWPARALLLAAAALVAAELIASRARRLALAARVALLAGLGAIAALGFAPPTGRVVFVLDVSASVAPAADAARAELVRRAAALPSGERAALVIVAGGARIAVPLGPPADVIAWARRAGPAEAAALGVDPARTDLAAGLALAGAALAGPGGELVLIGDGRDSVRGAAAARDAPALIGRGFALAPVDAGDLARVELPASSLRAAPGRGFTLPVTIEARLAAEVTITVGHRGAERARRTVAVAAGRTTVGVPVVLADAGPAELEVAIAVAGDPVVATDRARALVEVGDTARVLTIDGAAAGALAPAALAAVDAVVLDDVPGAALDAPAVDALDAFVRGGGVLLWAAGPRVAVDGAGALDRLLPLRAAAGDRVALMLLVDRSGSIDAAGGQAPLAGAAELAAAASGLGPDDLFGALAFDVVASDWVALAPARADLVVPALPPARGGTDPTAALELAGARLAAAPADARKLVVLVTDGGFAHAAGRATLAAAALAARGLRVEVLAIGRPDADARAHLDALATAGGGRVHQPTAGLAAALPAVRTAPRAPADATVQLARARPAWTTVLGPIPPALAAGAPVSTYVALAPAPDAIVLADVGDRPLLAARAHGAGRVLAWAADLHGAWIAPELGPTLFASIGRLRTAIDLEAMPVRDHPGTVDARVTTSTDIETPMRARVAMVTGFEREVVFTPAAPGALRAIIAELPAGRFSVDNQAGVRAQLLIADGEHAALGMDPDVASLGRSPTRPRSEITAPWLPLAALSVIVCVLGLLRATRPAPCN